MQKTVLELQKRVIKSKCFKTNKLSLFPCLPLYFPNWWTSSYSYIALISLPAFLWHSLLTTSQPSHCQKWSPSLSRPACLHREWLFLSWCSYHNLARAGNQPSSENPAWLLLIFNLLERLRLCQICNVYISDRESLLANTTRAQLGFIDSRCLVGEGHSQTPRIFTPPYQRISAKSLCLCKSVPYQYSLNNVFLPGHLETA